MADTAKLFMNGRSQAVRLPKAYRFEGTEVRVRREGDKVVLEPIAAAKPDFDVDAWFARIDALRLHDFMPEGVIDDPPPLGPDDEVDLGLD